MRYGAPIFVTILFISSILGAVPSSALGSENPVNEPLESSNEELVCGLPIYEDILAQKDGASSRYLAATGAHAYIFVDGGNPTKNQIDDLSNEFDNVIWPIDTDVFGTISKDRINIHLDTIDGPYGTGGYFVPGTWDIYIDVADLDIWGYQIAAHEFQHLIHDKHDSNEDLWVNEGMADLAIQMVYGPEATGISGHLNAFEDSPDNDLTVFDNEMYDYGSAYVFALYLWEHFGGNDTIRDIVDNKQNGFTGITAVLQTVDADQKYSDIELFSLWSVANILDDNNIYNGLYGYRTIDINMLIEGTTDTYPVTFQSFVESWANDYYSFRSGDKRDLALEVARIEGSFNFSLIGVGSAGVLVRSAIVTQDDPSKEIYLPSFGSDYLVAYLAVSGWEGQRYRFSAEFKDNTPPVTAIAVNPPDPDGDKGFYISIPTIGFITSETATTYYNWDNGNQTQYCPECDPQVIPIPPEGNHTLNFHSVDLESNVETPSQEKVFLVDTIKPETYTNITPPAPDGEDGWYISKTSVSITSEEGARILYRWDSGFYHNYSVPLIPEEGKHRLFYYSIDPAGNEGDVHQRDIKMDLSVPEIQVKVFPGSPDGKAGWYITQPTIAVTNNEADANAYYRIDDTQNLVYNAPFKVPTGTHTAKIWAKDNAGNIGETIVLDLKVDLEAPKTILDIWPKAPDGEQGWYVHIPTIDMDTDKDGLIYYRWDSAPVRRYTGTIDVEEGVHDLYYWSKDKAGNIEPENHLEVKVDLEVPETDIQIRGIQSFGWYMEPPLITFYTTEGAAIYYRWDNGSETRYTIPTTGKDGVHVISFHSVDPAGNREAERSLDLKVDTSDPIASFTTIPAYVFIGDEMVFDASASTDNIGIASYVFEFGDGSIEKLGDEPSVIHIYDIHGTQIVTLTVRDKSGREATITKEVYVEKPVKSEKNSGLLSIENMFIGSILLLIIVALIGLVAVRVRKRKALVKYLEIYEAQQVKARNKKAKKKKTTNKNKNKNKTTNKNKKGKRNKKKALATNKLRKRAITKKTGKRQNKKKAGKKEP